MQSATGPKSSGLSFPHDKGLDRSGAPGEWAEGEGKMKQNKARTEIDLKIGDRVRLVSGTLTWKGEIALQGKLGEVTELRDDGRVTIRFDGGRLLVGRDAEHFERLVEIGLKAKK
jgi:hypothetical protein